MKKIPCVFCREFDSRPPKLTPTVTPGCEWVLGGEGIATIKWDGAACMVRNGELYKRYDAKHDKPAPANGIPCTLERDPVTGHWPHWVPISADGKSNDKQHRKLWDSLDELPPDGTYELCGPKVNGNHHGLEHLVLWEHGSEELISYGDSDSWRTFDDIGYELEGLSYEGLVFHHPDGRMAKIRRADYGLEWPIKTT